MTLLVLSEPTRRSCSNPTRTSTGFATCRKKDILQSRRPAGRLRQDDLTTARITSVSPVPPVTPLRSTIRTQPQAATTAGRSPAHRRRAGMADMVDPDRAAKGYKPHRAATSKRHRQERRGPGNNYRSPEAVNDDLKMDENIHLYIVNDSEAVEKQGGRASNTAMHGWTLSADLQSRPSTCTSGRQATGIDPGQEGTQNTRLSRAEIAESWRACARRSCSTIRFFPVSTGCNHPDAAFAFGAQKTFSPSETTFNSPNAPSATHSCGTSRTPTTCNGTGSQITPSRPWGATPAR